MIDRLATPSLDRARFERELRFQRDEARTLAASIDDARLAKIAIAANCLAPQHDQRADRASAGDGRDDFLHRTEAESPLSNAVTDATPERFLATKRLLDSADRARLVRRMIGDRQTRQRALTTAVVFAVGADVDRAMHVFDAAHHDVTTWTIGGPDSASANPVLTE
jgi:hypothetical protein